MKRVTAPPGRGEWAVLSTRSVGTRHPGLDMSSQEAPRARRFPIEAGDCRSAAAALESQQRVGTAWTAGRRLRRCPANHCLTLPHVPIDVFIAMGGNCRPRST
ncbi:protein FAM229A isoform X1 [Gallus gallus]|uniref:protein FAM229A isoform X1 n=1 Tax=Gallus gallus TaxID=9031 RepID=UPI0003504002|nr:protein FAM229A isoform X1 [Gallus gallus]XP_040545794.1 protein FAM229A isoform X1 [Gallus gallus]|eukprot:XP_004947891.1 protein FAM229A [Gallus gallus]